eukprot:CAMPEP_0198555460 /NCGR_PEP_ID=MMETSP1462-20131121/84755_1 /TAXON_ID=1333877 /ORGANISM="Brandtodinium nutriculum, Strain RCC3387" /LENGTH=87 /DNA_ID=CAMNT_0044286187 /DNA_START=157 /DNA_END=418 /DNA_ORIENTATION=+
MSGSQLPSYSHLPTPPTDPPEAERQARARRAAMLLQDTDDCCGELDPSQGQQQEHVTAHQVGQAAVQDQRQHRAARDEEGRVLQRSA